MDRNYPLSACYQASSASPLFVCRANLAHLSQSPSRLFDPQTPLVMTIIAHCALGCSGLPWLPSMPGLPASLWICAAMEINSSTAQLIPILHEVASNLVSVTSTEYAIVLPCLAAWGCIVDPSLDPSSLLMAKGMEAGLCVDIWLQALIC